MKQTFFNVSKRWLQLGLTSAFAATLSINTQAQTTPAPAIQWDKTFGANGWDYCHDMQQTTDGGYILGGFSNSGISGNKTQASQGNFDYWIVKSDAAGNKSWDRSFGGSEAEFMYAVQQTNDGGFILGGASISGISGDKTQASRGSADYWLVKTDANGNKQWDKSFGGSMNDRLYALQQTSDNGYILAGFSDSDYGGDKTQFSNGGVDFWVVKVDASGNKQWDKAFGGTGSEVIHDVHELANGGYILGGYSNSGLSGNKSQPSNGGSDYWVVKLTANGTKVWDKTFGGNDLDDLRSVVETSDRGFLIGGYSKSGINGDKSQAAVGNSDYWILKIDSSGTKIWDKTFGGFGQDNLLSMQQTTDNGFILGGISNSHAGADKSQYCVGLMDYWIVKVNSNGTKLWDKTIGALNEDKLSVIKQTSDGSFLLAGTSKSNNSGDKSQASYGEDDYWVVKLGPAITGIQESETSFNLSISPNPNQGQFKLQINNVMAAKVEVTISDLLGRTILNKDFSITDQQLSENLTLPVTKGMYLLQVKAGNEITSRKIVVE